MGYLKTWLLAIILFVAIPISCANAKSNNTKLPPCPDNASCSHGMALFGPLKYKHGFTHFDYVNPNAPKGGEIKFASQGTFDSLNSYILKGVPASGIGQIYDSLLVSSKDEPFSKYGLLAHRVDLDNERNWVIFHLRPEARWHDRQPITADDVVFSLNILRSKGHPFYRSYYADVEKAEKIDAYTVKFSFKNNDNRELPFIIGEMPILPQHYWHDGNNDSQIDDSQQDFTKTTLVPPLGSGPYKVSNLESGKYITYQRVDDYWAKDLPVNKGRNNFDEMRYDYYRDATISVEALKSGQYDLRIENVSKNWATAYENLSSIKDGKMIKEAVQHSIPTGMQAFVFNLRRSKFSDRRVREAFGLAFDFEWSNKALFYNAYQRTESFFSNSDFASSGLPSAGETALLEQFKDILPESLFTDEYQIPKNDGSGNIRPQLRKAKSLLEEAGWFVKEGKLTHNKTGEVMEIEFLLSSPTMERVVLPFIKNLNKLGVKSTVRTVDASQYIKRLESFDFDMTTYVFGQSSAPGNEQTDYWHSSRADVNGSRNIAGIKNKAVDFMVDQIITAQNYDNLKNATHALDRILLNEHYVIPHFHSRVFRLIYWNKFGIPKIRAKYGLATDSWWAL